MLDPKFLLKSRVAYPASMIPDIIDWPAAWTNDGIFFPSIDFPTETTGVSSCFLPR